MLGGRISGILDASLPPLFFLFGDWLCCPDLGLRLALLASVFMALLRLWRQEPIWAALGGLGLAGFAGLLAIWRINLLAYFLPGMLSGAITVFVCLLSLALRRPLVAWTSYLARNWPLAWYWHPQVRPAYAEVTSGWALVFGLRGGAPIPALRQRAGQRIGIEPGGPGLAADFAAPGGQPFIWSMALAAPGRPQRGKV